MNETEINKHKEKTGHNQFSATDYPNYDNFICIECTKSNQKYIEIRQELLEERNHLQGLITLLANRTQKLSVIINHFDELILHNELMK